MTNTQTLSLPMVLPSGPDCARCVERLTTELRGIKGVERADVDTTRDTITVVFDPDSVTLSRIESEAKRAGAGIASRIEHRTLELRDLDCPDCAATIEKAVSQLPGVLWAGANFAAGQMHAEFERGKVQVADITRVVEQHGARACPLPGLDSTTRASEPSIWTEHRKLIVTAIAATLSVVAVATGSSFLYAAAIVIGGWSTAKAALAAIRTRVVDMNVLMTLAVIGAAAIGEWLEGATVVVLYNIGGLLQAYTVERTRRSIRALMDLSPKSARVRRNGFESDVAVELVRISDTVLVKPGERIPIDGDITAGRSALNEAPITGESMPAEKGPGDSVFAGTLNGQGALEMTATHRYRDTTLARIIHKVEEAQAQRAPAQQFIDRFAAVYTPAVVLLAALVALIPPAYIALVTTSTPAWSEWFMRALSLLIISCPCALVISTPVAIVTALGAASRRGVLIKGGAYLEEIGRVKAILYDKTGTLTTGRFQVAQVVPFAGESAESTLAIAAALESRSEHPLADAFLRAYGSSSLPPAEAVESIPGRGVRGMAGGEQYFVGNEALMRETGLELEAVRDDVTRAAQDGWNPILLADSTTIRAMFLVSDSTRPDAADSIATLRRLGIDRHDMLTGDSAAVAGRIASDLNLSEFRAELLPEEKLEHVKRIRQESGSLAMIGDGINDAPALAASNVGIAMGAAASDTALETADIAILGDDLMKLPYLVRLSRRTRGIIQQNVLVSLVTKGILIAAALTVGLPLWLAVLGDVGISLLVTLNGLRLLRAVD